MHYLLLSKCTYSRIIRKPTINSAHPSNVTASTLAKMEEIKNDTSHEVRFRNPKDGGKYRFLFTKLKKKTVLQNHLIV
jgi:hypothetical protein